MNPVGSWIARLKEKGDEEDVLTLRSPRAGEGSEILSGIFKRKVFNYPKPPTLIENVLRHTARPDDIVLDFFAGSGTTAHAVLKLNHADEGRRKFIMVSSSEATRENPGRNLCRDVCAERLRHVIAGYAGLAPLGGSFAYARVAKINPVDFAYDVSPEQAWNTLRLFHVGALKPYIPDALNIIERDADGITVFCATVTEATLKELREIPVRKIRVYSDRPETVLQALEDGHSVESLGITDAVRMA